ncbi:carboxylating nicotinate-nucleotide diphosphorylase [Kamptonema cortianum]|nr:carboxylating nicotinate-nucleotide diphosphorylase [Geitlerinema splendidum]MDK3155200.1 carboxylating nicotinate-nucleotide diphosphorylase [Kamptonema cortianum]
MSLGWKRPIPEGWIEWVFASLAEDVGAGDLSAAIFDDDHVVNWYIEALDEGVVCGVGMAFAILQPDQDDPDSCRTDVLLLDGEPVSRGSVILKGKAVASKLLTRERTALNFLMHLSGIASLTFKYVEKVAEYGCDIVDTRKTTPGLRALEKYAVRCGGGRNHRMGLYDGIMVKDNHIRAAGSITEAVERAKRIAGQMTMIEVECETEDQVAEAVRAGVDIVMLDNMDPFMMQSVVRKYRGEVRLEASGGITLETVQNVAAIGVHSISVGALTHSAPALPFHLEVE